MENEHGKPEESGQEELDLLEALVQTSATDVDGGVLAGASGSWLPTPTSTQTRRKLSY